MRLEQTISSALMQWRLVERAVHGRGSWAFRYHGVTVPAVRFIRESRVSFSAHFDPFCPLGEGEPMLELLADGEVVRCFALEEPLDEDGAAVWWDLVVEDRVPA